MLGRASFAKPLALVALSLALVVAACAGNVSGVPGGAGGGTSTACPETLAAACAPGEPPGQFGVSCAMTWQAALADMHYCGTTVTEEQADCGAYLARITVNVDVAFTYYYDKATGALVAVSGEGGTSSSVTCVGGPSVFVVPACGTSKPLVHCVADGGIDGP